MTPAILTPLQLQAKVDALTVVVEYLMARISNGTSDVQHVHGTHLEVLLNAYPNLDQDTRQALEDVFTDGQRWLV